MHPLHGDHRGGPVLAPLHPEGAHTGEPVGVVALAGTQDDAVAL